MNSFITPLNMHFFLHTGYISSFNQNHPSNMIQLLPKLEFIEISQYNWKHFLE